jgi:threonine dehydrogenase-like Zn-dependent dehydrogenase
LLGGFSEDVVDPSDNVYSISEHIGYGEAAIMEVYGTNVQAINKTNTHMDQTVVIIGAGPIGLSLLDLVNIAGAKGIIIDVFDYPLEFAEKTIGALEAIKS